MLLWPRRASARSALAGLRAMGTPDLRPTAALGDGDGSGGLPPSIWQRDPADLYRQWRLRRRPGELVDDVLDLLRGVGRRWCRADPTRAIELAATSASASTGCATPGRWPETTEPADRPRATALPSPTRLDTWRPSLQTGTHWVGSGRGPHPAASRHRPARGCPARRQRPCRAHVPVWAAWAERSASAELALVAAAWRLSETTGAPLASAVDRAVVVSSTPERDAARWLLRSRGRAPRSPFSPCSRSPGRSSGWPAASTRPRST